MYNTLSCIHLYKHILLNTPTAMFHKSYKLEKTFLVVYIVEGVQRWAIRVMKTTQKEKNVANT